jgi:aryl-alcohol dehydrogenase
MSLIPQNLPDIFLPQENMKDRKGEVMSNTIVTAAVVREPKGKFSIEELELDEIRPNEVRVRLVAVGLCHTDIAMRDAVYPIPMPVVLGHEGGGMANR